MFKVVYTKAGFIRSATFTRENSAKNAAKEFCKLADNGRAEIWNFEHDYPLHVEIDPKKAECDTLRESLTGLMAELGIS